VVGDGTVGSSNTISKENLPEKPLVSVSQPPPEGQELRGIRWQEVRAFIVAGKPGNINRWSEGRQEGR
jgi:hypothetical protein